MRNKAYIINFDIESKDNADYMKFHDLLTKDKGIINWWHYLRSSYIVIVGDDVTAASISKFIRGNWKDKLFFVSQLDLTDHDGWLPKDAWDWVITAINLTTD